MNIIQKYYNYRSYKKCRDLFENFSKSYYLGSMIFPFHKFKHICAIYGLVRVADNIVDKQIVFLSEIEEKKIKFDDFINSFYSIYDLSDEEYNLIKNDYSFWNKYNVIFKAVFETIKELNLEKNLFERFFKSMKKDLTKFKYESYEELEEYMDGSASVVGEIMLRIMSHNDDFYLKKKSNSRKCYAQILGISFQLTNFIRDIREDFNMHPSRIYLPLEDINKYNLDFDYYNDTNSVDNKFKNFIKKQIKKNRVLYSLSDTGINMLSPNDKIAIKLSRKLYSNILVKIEEEDYNLFNYKKINLDYKEKLNIIYEDLGIYKLIMIFINYIFYTYFFWLFI